MAGSIDAQRERQENWEVRNATEQFIRRIHSDGDADIRPQDIPTLLDAIADEFERSRDANADALQAVKDLLILVGRIENQLRHAHRIGENVGVKLSALRGTPCVSFGADPDLKPGPLTQEDRGWKPEDDER